MTHRRVPRALGTALLPLLAACAQQPVSDVPAPLPVPSAESGKDATKPPPVPAHEGDARIYKGSGVVVRGQGAGGTLPPGPPPPAKSGPVVLNFEGADLREVVRNILGDILNEAYTIDPNVGGQVTIRTTTGIPRSALPATLETLLRMNGATMVYEDNLWKIVPQTAAVRGNVTPQLGTSTRALPAGFSVQIVPLKYVGAAEMVKILEPFAKDAQAIRADVTRNLLILSGTEAELRHLRDTVDMHPEFYWAHRFLGRALELKGATSEAIAEYREAIRISPGLAQAHYNLGEAERRQGNRTAAAQAFRNFLRLASSSAESGESKDKIERARMILKELEE